MDQLYESLPVFYYHLLKRSEGVDGDRQCLSTLGWQEVLFIAYSAFGDILQQLPFCRALKKKYPQLRLTWLVCHPYQELLAGQSFIDDIIVWDRRKDERGFWTLIREIRARRFDCLIDMRQTDRSLVLTLLSGIPIKIGSQRKFSWPYNYKYRPEKIPALLGLSPERVSKPYLDITEAEREKARALLPDVECPRIYCILGASKPIKHWPVDSWREFLRITSDKGWNCCLVGHGEEEESMAHRICENGHGGMVTNLVGKLSFKMMAAVAARCDVAVGGDTGPLHLAHAMGIPVIGLFGPTLPEQVKLSDIHKAFLVPCDRRGGMNWDCPNQECLGAIFPESVVREISKMGLG